MPADPDEARRLAEEILRGPEYQQPAEPWWQAVLEWIDELVQRVVGTLSGSGGGSAIGWVIVVAVGVAVAAVVVQAIRTLRRSGRRRREDGAEPTPRRRRRDVAVDWEEEAARLEAQGRWRDGLRARYRALVGELVRRQVVDPAAARTTGEHRREVVEAAPDAWRDFDAAAELFDRAWYGARPTGPEEAARFEELAGRVRERSS